MRHLSGKNKEIVSRFYSELDLDSTNINAKYTAELLDPEIWNVFLDPDVADECVGSIPYKMLEKSYNDWSGTEAITSTVVDNGYNYSQTTLNATYRNKILVDTDGSDPHMLLIASPEGHGKTESLCKLRTSDYLFTNWLQETTTSPYLGIKPVVKLKSDTILAKDSNIWKISLN